MSNETDDLLYTQEDIDEYARTNDELVDHIFDLKQRIAELEEETEAYQKEINDFCNKRYFGCLKDADKKLTELEEKCKWQDKEIELDGEKLKQAAEEFNKQHELLDQYELDCTDEIVRLKNQKIKELEEEKEEFKKINKNFFQAISNYPNAMMGQRKRIDELTVQVKKLQEENAKLQEQLKSIGNRKYKLDEEVYIIWNGLVVDVRIYGYCKDGDYYVDTCHFDLSDWGGLFLSENDIFATEAEAQKYLKKEEK